MAIYKNEQSDEIHYDKMVDENEYEHTNINCRNINLHHIVIIFMSCVFIILSIAYIYLYFTLND
jgi:hypothetical protein